MKALKKDAGSISIPRKSVRMADNNPVSKSSLGGNYASNFTNTFDSSYGTSTTTEGHDISSLSAKINMLEKDLERRQESYISRERAYKVRIDELEEELANQRQEKTGWMKSDSKIGRLKNMQKQIMDNVDLVQDRTARILQEQERDLLRAFKARLFDVQTELEKEKSKKDDGAAAWIERSRQLESEVEWAKEVADRLERVNQTLLQENGRLKSQFQSQEEDRNFLIKQLVAVKKDNARLRAEYTELESENERLKSMIQDETDRKAVSNGYSAPGMAGTVPSSAGMDGMQYLLSKSNSAPGSPHALKQAFSSASNQHISTNAAATASVLQQRVESEERYKEVNIRLRRLLAEERKSLQQVRANYAQELKVRTELEMLLRQCVEDVRQEIARRHVESAQFSMGTGNDLAKIYSRQPGLIPMEDFTQEDRERVLELLLSQERVVSLLYAKTFPIISGGSNAKTVGVASNDVVVSSGNEDILLALTSIGLSADDGLRAGKNNRPNTGTASVVQLPVIGGNTASTAPNSLSFRPASSGSHGNGIQ